MIAYQRICLSPKKDGSLVCEAERSKVLASCGSGAQVEVLINPENHVDLSGRTMSSHDCAIMAQLGNIVQSQDRFFHLSAVSVPDNDLHLSAAVRAPTLVTINMAISVATEVGAGTDLYDAAALGMEEVWVHYMTPLGARLGPEGYLGPASHATSVLDGGV